MCNQVGTITNKAIINQIQRAGMLQSENMDPNISLKIGETPFYGNERAAGPAVSGAAMTFSTYIMDGGKYLPEADKQPKGLDRNNDDRIDEKESKPLNQLFTAAYNATKQTDETPNAVTSDELNRLAYALRDDKGAITKASVSAFQALPAEQQARKLGETFSIYEERVRSSGPKEPTSMVEANMNEGSCVAPRK
jgi:hypothetical protein